VPVPGPRSPAIPPTADKGLLLAAGTAGVVALGTLAVWFETSMTVALVAGFTQAAVAFFILRSADRLLSLVGLFVLAWMGMFTLRMIQISMGPDPLTNHPVVVNATHAEISTIWILSTVGLTCFGLGVVLARRIVRPGRVPEVTLSPLGTASLYYICIFAIFILAITGISSGLLVNLTQLYLFGIAYASYRSASSGRPFGMELVATLLACMLAILFGAKEYAILPVVAWGVGHFSVRRRLFTWKLVAIALLGALFYIGVQSQRVATALGDPRQDFIGATLNGLREYDYPTGLRREKTGLQIPLNALAGITSRIRGADSLFVIHSAVPERAEFEQGRTLWQPAMSVIPGAAQLIDLEFSQLSLGRYFNQTFWSLRPGEDPSAQAATIPGDLYLNFGTAGVAAGLLLIGFAYAAIDRRAPVCSATSAGLFAYAAIQMISIDRNVAYLLVTGAIRYGLGFLLIALLRHAILRGSNFGRPTSRGRPTSPAPATPSAGGILV
jgi:hypothetical protein